MEYILASAEHDHVVIDDYLAVWESYGTPADYLREDAEEVVRQFLHEGRRERKLASFMVVEGMRPVGSISCQLHMVPYPAVLKPDHMLHGYIWTVYTDPNMRGRGIAGRLLSLALKHLQDIGCTTVVLHSSDAGQNLYQRIGFQLAKEMRLKFATSA